MSKMLKVGDFVRINFYLYQGDFAHIDIDHVKNNKIRHFINTVLFESLSELHGIFLETGFQDTNVYYKIFLFRTGDVINLNKRFLFQRVCRKYG